MDFFTLWVIFSILIGLYANSKGRSLIGFTLLSIFLSPLFGLIIALIVAPIIAQGELKECNFCKELIKKDATFCKHCGKSEIQTQPHEAIKDEIIRDITREFKYDTYFIRVKNIQESDFLVVKNSLLDQYSKLGYDLVVVDNSNCWKIKSSTSDKTYIEVLLKVNLLTIEAFNTKEEPNIFPQKSSLNDIDRIIELGKMLDKGLITKEEFQHLKGSL